eukprot:scaffold2045_cov404-Prasinococcus_capsulatus_cf.AAC.53
MRESRARVLEPPASNARAAARTNLHGAQPMACVHAGNNEGEQWAPLHANMQRQQGPWRWPLQPIVGGERAAREGRVRANDDTASNDPSLYTGANPRGAPEARLAAPGARRAGRRGREEKARHRVCAVAAVSHVFRIAAPRRYAVRRGGGARTAGRRLRPRAGDFFEFRNCVTRRRKSAGCYSAARCRVSIHHWGIG